MSRRKLTADEVAAFGIRTDHHEQMDNGEYRFRLICDSDRTTYVRTVAGPIGAWQNSHFHKSTSETYIVQSGWMAYAWRNTNNVLECRVLDVGGIVTTATHVVHNVYLPCGAVIHTVKHGNAPDADWHEAKDFSAETESISEDEVLRRWSNR
jgi:hypothetical protein